MLDAALIGKCADPSLTPAIVEQFVQAVGSPDPHAISVKSGGRLILVPKAKTPDEAMNVIREHVGRAVVRVGLTQFPAGVGVKDASELKPGLVDACENLKMGTKMFAKILRIVAKWYGNPTNKDVFPQIFEDAVHAWKTGEFEGVGVFQANDPGGEVENHDAKVDQEDEIEASVSEDAKLTPGPSKENADAGEAEMRIDLSRIGSE
jgi:hypothetical protein